MAGELDVLRIVAERLDTGAIPYMLTGSFAMAYYATPRMTRDLDLVIALREADAGSLVASFVADFYIDAEAVRDAARCAGMFNLLHLESGIKVDLIIRKGGEYRELEFSRRRRVAFAGIEIWIVTREDLILSKLVWAKASGSELQRRDVRSLLSESSDMAYLEIWASRLEVLTLLCELRA